MIIKRVAPFSCAKVVGAIYAIFWLFIACLAAIVGLISLIARISTGGSSLSGPNGVPFFLPMMILPMLYGIGVFLAALIGAWLYNALAGVLGGIEVEVE
jgi:hypothetical protein